MTRTERSHSLRALIKDRSEARNGMDSSLPKGGGGAHNWGSLDSELRYETEAIADEADELEDEVDDTAGKCHLPPCLLSFDRPLTFRRSAPPIAPNQRAKKSIAMRRTSSVTDEDRENAIKIRKNALKSNGGMSSCRPRADLL
jgi:hypothetical protein